MNQSTKTKYQYRYVLIVVLIVWHIFIFGQSILPGDVSSEQSGFIVNLVKPIFNVFIPNMSIETMSIVIRKLAHVTEFFILGLLLINFYGKNYTYKYVFYATLIHGLVVASLDETIQLFSLNRAGLITDVFIDMIGVVLSVIVYVVVNRIKS